jgi:hypothetical protein
VLVNTFFSTTIELRSVKFDRDMMMNAQELKREEDRRIRLLRISSDLLVQVFMTQPMSVSEAQEMILRVRNFAIKLFPGKERVFDLVYVPRFRRALREAGLGNHRANLKVRSGYQRSNGE